MINSIADFESENILIKYLLYKIFNLFIKFIFAYKIVRWLRFVAFVKIKEINNNKKFLIKITLLILNWLYKIAFNYRVG